MKDDLKALRATHEQGCTPYDRMMVRRLDKMIKESK